MRATRLDYHIHESYSSDARESKVEDYVKIAEKRGIEEIAFTTHQIITGPFSYFGVQPDEVESYVNNIHRIDETTDVKLLVGLEIDYFSEASQEIETLIDEYPFDFILGSTHFIGRYDVGSSRDAGSYFGGRSLNEATADYYRVWIEAVESGLFDSMAHPDYWRRFLYLVRKEPVEISEYGLLGEAIESLIRNDVAIEVNTSGRRHEHGEQYPIRAFLEAAYEAGLRRITLGSDSHIPEHLGFWIPEAVDMLKEIGYKQISGFEQRKNTLHPIDSIVRNVKNK